MTHPDRSLPIIPSVPRTAWVALQEANALAIVDIRRAEVTDIVPLGFKDHLAPGNGFDASNRDDMINIANWPTRGMYMPDGIASYPTQHEDGTFGWLMVLPKDNYDIKLVGTGQGPYKLTTVNYEDDGQANTIVYEGTTQLGQADDYKVAAPVPAVTVTAPPPSQTSNGNGKGGSGATTPGLLVSLLLLLLAQRRLRAANKTATAAI